MIEVRNSKKQKNNIKFKNIIYIVFFYESLAFFVKIVYIFKFLVIKVFVEFNPFNYILLSAFGNVGSQALQRY